MHKQFYLLKIKLLDIEPAIWRRFVVPATIPLDRLHEVIQIVMGWTDSHLYEFIIGNKRYTEDHDSKEDGLESGRFRLRDLIKQQDSTFSYLYDFSDYWMHEIVLEESPYFYPEQSPEVVCLEGRRACPPEDVGGLSGYFEFCYSLRVPHHKEHESNKQWSGGDFDSERFDSGIINSELIKYLYWTRDRYQTWAY